MELDPKEMLRLKGELIDIIVRLIQASPEGSWAVEDAFRIAFGHVSRQKQKSA